MSLSNFSSYSLTRAQIKNVVGGGNTCSICSKPMNPSGEGGACNSPTMSYADAERLAYELNLNNPDPSNPYYYYPFGCSPW